MRVVGPRKAGKDYIFKTGFVRLRDLELIGSFSNQSVERERRRTSVHDAFLVKDNELLLPDENISRECARAFRQSILLVDRALFLTTRRGNYSASPSS